MSRRRKFRPDQVEAFRNTARYKAVKAEKAQRERDKANAEFVERINGKTISNVPQPRKAGDEYGKMLDRFFGL
jgi:hypothetical protein